MKGENANFATGGGMGKPKRLVPGGGGASIFDPVLCEIVYRWFCPPAPANILDPFAGGSVRGIVAAVLGHKYTGVDLASGQIAANIEQGKAVVQGNTPRWICGDSANVQALAPGDYDLLFSCPPYGDLEVYSEEPGDISNMDFERFAAAYTDIISKSAAMLKENRFACFVVGDYRDKKGYYRGLPALTCAAFEKAGMKLYNDAILVTAVGSLPIRVGRQFGGYRKLGKTHQNVLIFFKGDPKTIKGIYGEMAIPDEIFRETEATPQE